MKLKRLLSIAVIFSILCSLPVPIQVSAAGYDAGTAVNYARSHWNDGKGLCAEFVSDCLTAGGIKVNQTITGRLRNWLVSNNYATDYTITKTQGARIKMSDYSGKIAIGDVLINYCPTCRLYPHVMLITGTDSNGYITYHAHNSARANQTYYNSSTGYSLHPGHSFEAHVLHMNGASSSSGGNQTVTPVTPVHTHSFTNGTKAAHPHNTYKYCSGCGTEVITGKQMVTSCSQCYPIGNAKLTREFNRTSGKTTFYRNNVSNANDYTLNIYRDGSLQTSLNMSGTSYTTTLEQGHSYSATLTAKNSSTGQTRYAECNSFRIYNTYNVSYNANGGSGAPYSQTKIQDENLTLSSSKPTKAHYVFKGWASSKTATDAQYQAGGIYTKNATITLYAVWEPEIYTINFDANGGKGDLESAKITYGNSMRMPNNVVNTGYYLRGWATNKNATEPQYKIGVDYKFEANTTLYAVWGSTGWAQEIADGFAGGDGTEENPYQISSAAELAYLASTVNSQTEIPEYKYYILTDNINLGYNEWVPIGLYGNDTQLFYGSFDGNGFTISDIYMTEAREGYVGLFGYVKDSEIKNLTITGAIENVTTSGTLDAGGIVGYGGSANIEKCNAMYFTISGISVGTSSLYSHTGCIIGRSLINGHITDCHASECSVNLKAGNCDAGIIAGQSTVPMKNCTVTATENGLISTVATTRGGSIGGLCGALGGTAESCSVTAPYFTNEIHASASRNVGGLVGYLTSEVKVCSVQFTNGKIKTINGEEYNSSIYSTTTSDTAFVGGIVGRTENNSAKITDCKYDGQSITSIAENGYGIAGGIAGRMTAKRNPTVTVNGGQTLSRAELPKKDGYKATWYTDSAFKNKYDFSQTVTSNMTLYAKWEEGTEDIWDGTSTEPTYNSSTKTYTITNGEELAWFRDVVNGVITEGTIFPTDKTFKGYTVELTNDIYLNDTAGWENWSSSNKPQNNWQTIGYSEKIYFAGTFDGKNHSIVGMYQNGYGNNGLFGYNTGTIRNIMIENAYIKSTGDTGGITGYNSGTVEYAGVKSGSICGYGDVGGIVGCNEGGGVYHCYNFGNIMEGSCVGGIVGHNGDNGNQTSVVRYCYNGGAITSYGTNGGIVGYNNGRNCIVRVDYCYNTGAISNAGGGIVGVNSSNNDYTALVFRCYNIGKISGTDSVGGIAGANNGSVLFSNSFSHITETYNVGSISGSNYVGGIVGSIESLSSANCRISYSYATQPTLYNIETGFVDTYSIAKKTAAQMKNLSNLSGFSTSDWAVNSSINGGYPYLKSMEDTYKTYTITAVADTDNSAIKRSFANVDGIIYAESGTRGAYAGGILGQAHGTSAQSKSTANGLLAIANNIDAKTSSTSSSYTADSGYIVGWNSDNYFDFTGAYYNSDILSNRITNTTGTSRPTSALKIPSFLTSLVGLNAYQSLDHLKEDDTAVWVIKNGELPELYYNCLNDITISEDIENGSITANKTQGIDGEVVEITAAPAEGYVLNKAYVNGEEIVGTTFEISGNSEIYATFIQETPEYSVTIAANDNVAASLVNVDEEGGEIETYSVRLMSAEPVTEITASDGEEIAVNAIADEDYTVDAVYVNGEEIVGDNFILTEDTEVTLEVSSLSTETQAITKEPEYVDADFAILSGNTEGDIAYIKYWNIAEPDIIQITEAKENSREYSVVISDLEPNTTYEYQMCDTGEVKRFTTLSESSEAENDTSNPNPEPIETDTPQETETPMETDSPKETDSPQETDIPQQTEQPAETDEPIIVPETMPFEIQNAAVNEKVTADIVNVSDTAQSGILIFAAYTNDEKLVSVKSQNINNIEASGTLPCEFDIPEGADKYKLFMWHSWKHIAPLAKSTEIK